MLKIFQGTGAFFASTLGLTGAASAEQALVDWQIWHQPANSEMMRQIIAFDWWTLYFIVPITLLVVALLAYVMVRFRASANPNPSTVSHNSLIEVIWTLGPVVILVAISIPSFQLLTAQYSPPEDASITVKATGYQWYWGYEYQDDNEISFDSVLIGRDGITEKSKVEAKEEREEYGKTDMAMYPRLLAVDNELVVPVGKVVRVLITAADVIHNFAMPAFGLKTDAVPGRINEAWFKAESEGLFYGQCSELCGKDHAFMPIAIRVVSEEQFKTWQEAAADDVEEANKALMAIVDVTNKTVQVAGQ